MIGIFLHNTLTGKKEEFKPIHKDKVSMYNCGPTVYNFAHIGNLRSYIFADILRRTLEYGGFKVKQVINITDVGHLVSNADQGDDKVEKEAKAQRKTAQEISEFYEDAFKKDLKDLNVETKDTIFPKATENIEEQIEIIKKLEEKGFTYKISDGIYFDTAKFLEYGKLGNINIKGQEEGARVEKNTEKRNPSDFALWKFSPLSNKSEEKRQQEWESPWGVGFPGWHIECSAMSRKFLDQPFDIHTGGVDHIPVHHNNEIAQSECAFNCPLANYWLHNEFLLVEGEKMAKSLGNIFTLSDLKEKGIHPLSFRFWLLSGHYKTPMNFTWESVKGSQIALERLVLDFIDYSANGLAEIKESAQKALEEKIFDDLDTPGLLVLLQGTSRIIFDSQNLDGQAKIENKKTAAGTMLKIGNVLGIPFDKLAKKMKEIPEEIIEIKRKRNKEREAKNWEESDKLRKEMEEKGYIVGDTSSDTLIIKKLSAII